ncbi:MAG TPA: SMI1/KNR4 family protein [Pseudomonas sp.]|nr:SMI1/KNR4 family protein [Pseudomonas sp.]
MAINKLTALLPSPQAPVDSGVGKKWPEIEPGLSFPSDYVDFIRVYGSGRIADFLVIFNPFSDNQDINFFDQFKLILDDLEELNQSDSEYYSYPIYPAPNSLIPLGVTDNGDYIFWTANSTAESDSWGVAIIPSRSPDIEYFQMSLTTTLAEILSGNVRSSSFPDLFAAGIIRFDVI